MQKRESVPEMAEVVYASIRAVSQVPTLTDACTVWCLTKALTRVLQLMVLSGVSASSSSFRMRQVNAVPRGSACGADLSDCASSVGDWEAEGLLVPRQLFAASTPEDLVDRS